MKTLNDSLREEFKDTLKEPEFRNQIKDDKLDSIILNKAFDVLLSNKEKFDAIDSARLEFENFLINQIKSKIN